LTTIISDVADTYGVNFTDIEKADHTKSNKALADFSSMIEKQSS